MKRLFVCLANSYKEGGRCVGGILIEKIEEGKYHIITDRNRPVWIRPVSDVGSGQLKKEWVEKIHILDIVAIDVIQECSSGAHCENVTFREDSLIIIGSVSKRPYILEKFIDHSHSYVFEDNCSKISHEEFNKLDYSLMFIRPSSVNFYEHEYEDTHKRKLRVIFEHNGYTYNLPVTDPDFLAEYKKDPGVVERYRTYYLTLSLGVEFNGWHYKLAAGIIGL